MSRETVEAIVGDYLKAHPGEIGAMVKVYVLRHPEVFRVILVELNSPEAGRRRSEDGDNGRRSCASDRRPCAGPV